MSGRPVRVVLWTGLVVLICGTLFAQERWVYRYDQGAQANSIVVGSDAYVYAAGLGADTPYSTAFTVVSLSASGDERWIYRYCGPTNGHNEAYSIVMGPDGNLYAAGLSPGTSSYPDLTVVGLTPLGEERWVYRYNGPGDMHDVAYSVIAGSDSNLYAAGMTRTDMYDADFTVVSLTASGEERWVYRYDGPMNYDDQAYSITMGADGCLYAAGVSYGWGTETDFTVVSLSASGEERWVYRYNGPASSGDKAYSVLVGSDGNIYAAGYSLGSALFQDFTVVSLTALGGERWIYRYDGPANRMDEANTIILGPDGYIYAAGYSHRDQADIDLTVVSLTPAGGERWVYRYSGPGDSAGAWANSIVSGMDGNLYAAGYCYGGGTWSDIAVVSLTPAGGERWVYRYNGPGNGDDEANSIAAGPDASLYAAGRSHGGSTGSFTVVSLSPNLGVKEALNRSCVFESRLTQNHPNPFDHSTIISYSLPRPSDVSLSIYNVTGRLVETLVNETKQPGIHQVQWGRKANPSGVYFYRLRAGEFVETRKMVVVE